MNKLTLINPLKLMGAKQNSSLQNKYNIKEKSVENK